ncbi:polysaccharide deacetylase [Sphingomonas sp. AR_OL41]|uniref:polysaccharide deacetylase n=1 Tax=Sphingomonas sp. AR_OL41 TaxID=3042729 RepID=UPI00247FD012|nr:polysaccharide deacetylase [Sphingomonas sp. AR_OL41]MDH7973087.1 polysaccharide deacetylase [Sphingomonas sp. AR_OL41]
MTTPVFLTVDAALQWRHHAERLAPTAIVEHSIEPAGVGLSFQLARLAQHGLHATFFVDPMPALLFGLDPVRRIVDTVLDAGQDVQLLLHPAWAGAVAGDGGAQHGRHALADYTAEEQRDLIIGARDLLVAAGAPEPVAFRAGAFSANADTLSMLGALGFAYDSSRDASVSGAASRGMAPGAHGVVVEVPVTLIDEGAGSLRALRVDSLSAGEMSAALDHAEVNDHAAVTIVCDSAALANRAATRGNAINVSRFEALCAMLAERRDTLPTCRFDQRPALRLGQRDAPLEPHHLRTGWRQAEQLWSTMVEERAA